MSKKRSKSRGEQAYFSRDKRQLTFDFYLPFKVKPDTVVQKRKPSRIFRKYSRKEAADG
jgi:hypothetical protein